MPFRVTRTPLATRQIRDENAWWRRNRSSAPALFRNELRRALELIAEYPQAGPFADDADEPGIRCVLLVRTQHYVYYRVNEEQQTIEVLAVWSTSRGTPPRLR